MLAQQQADLAEKLKRRKGTVKCRGRPRGRRRRACGVARQFLEDSSGTYRDQVDPLTRRHWNQVLLRRIFVGPEGVRAVELTDGFGSLLREDLAEQVEAFMANPTAALRAGGSTFDRVVEAGGIEPPAAACKAAVFPLTPRPRRPERSPG